jgi:hypothetical protein
VLLRDDVVGLVWEERIILMHEAVFTPSAGALAYTTPDERGDILFAHPLSY